MQRGSYMSNFGSKGQRSNFRRLSDCTYFLTRYLNTSWSVFLPTLYTDPGWWKRDAPKVWGQTVIDQCHLRPLSKSASWLCQFQSIVPGRALYICVLLSISDDFSLLWNIPSRPYWFFFTFIIPGSRDIAQVVQTVQIDLQKFRFTEHGSNLAFVLINIAHNFYKMQKGHVIASYKIIQ